jgi:hypothetical protein
MIVSALRTCLAVLFGIVLLTVNRAAWAAPATDADKALARELGRSGLDAYDAKDYPTAVDRLTRAISLYDVPTLRLARAHALRAMGRLVSASEDYHAILLRTPLPDDPPAIVQATRDAKTELPEIEAKIAHLTVVMTGGSAGLRVDGVDWPAAAVGVPSPIDPGDHLVEATTTSGPVQSQNVSLSPGQSARVELVVPATSAGPPPAPDHTSAQPNPTGPAPLPGYGPASPAAPAADRTPAYVTLAISGALAIGAVVTGVMMLGKKSDYDKANNASTSFATKDDLRSQASSLAVVSTVLTGAAIVGGGISLYLFLTPGQKGSEAAPHAAARATTAGFVLSKRF